MVMTEKETDKQKMVREAEINMKGWRERESGGEKERRGKKKIER